MRRRRNSLSNRTGEPTLPGPVQDFDLLELSDSGIFSANYGAQIAYTETVDPVRTGVEFAASYKKVTVQPVADDVGVPPVGRETLSES